jgi:hypothetical protein
MPPFTRRSFTLSLLITPMACLGCGAESISVDAKAGEKRRKRIEDLQKRADLERKSGEKNVPSR